MIDSVAVRLQLIDAHRATLSATVGAARAVAATWEADSITDSDRITAPLERELRERGLATALLALLETGADALDAEIQGDPVPAPPYLAVTGRGPVLRATLADGRRLVVTIAPFEVERSPTRYRFRDPEPADALAVEIR